MELVIVLGLLGILLGIVASATGGWRDALAVRAARDELAAGLAAARVTAAGKGGAALVLDTRAAAFWVATESGTGVPTSLSERYGVRIEGGDGLLEFRYDALGIGRLANRTVLLRRGAAEGGIVVSAYGRVRRW